MCGMRDQEVALMARMEAEAQRLAEGLERAAAMLRAASLTVEQRPAGVRAVVDVEADDALAALSEARQAVEGPGVEFAALAAIGGYPLGRIGEVLGLTETGAAVRLAQAEVLAGAVRGQRVTRRDLTRAGAALDSA